MRTMAGSLDTVRLLQEGAVAERRATILLAHIFQYRGERGRLPRSLDELSVHAQLDALRAELRERPQAHHVRQWVQQHGSRASAVMLTPRCLLARCPSQHNADFWELGILTYQTLR